MAKLTSSSDIHNWIKKVEDASTRAAEITFGTGQARRRDAGHSSALVSVDQLRIRDEAYSEAQEFLSQWVEDNIHVGDTLDFEDVVWHECPVQTEKQAWNDLLDGLEIYSHSPSGEDTTPKQKDNSDPYAFLDYDENEAVASVLQRMLDKKLIQDGVTKDLGIHPTKKAPDPRLKMELRHQQVKEKREQKQKELVKKHREQQMKREAHVKAQHLIMQEQKEKELKKKKEEREIQKEMANIRKKMQEEKKHLSETRHREKQQKETVERLAAWQHQQKEKNDEDLKKIRAHQQEEKRRRETAIKMELLQAKNLAINLKIIQKHFSAWYDLVLTHRLQLGKARALAEWRLLLQAWNTWKLFARARCLQRDSEKHERNMKNTYRKKQLAVQHCNFHLLHMCFSAWRNWTQSEQNRHELEKERAVTKNKMMLLLDAAASGKLHEQRTLVNDTPDLPVKMKPHAKPIKRSASASNLASARGDLSTSRSKRSEPNKRLPVEPWQVSRKHAHLSKSEIASLGAADGECVVHADNKIKKRFGLQPWMRNNNNIVNNFEHRYASQQKILLTQQQQLKHQQQLIEDLQFQQQLAKLQSAGPSAPFLAQDTDGGKKNSSRSGPQTLSAFQSSRSGGHTFRTETSDFTSVSMQHQPTRYLTVVRNMEERAAHRTDLKRRREEKRRKEEEESKARLQVEKEEMLKREKEEKKVRMKLLMEKRRLEKQKEIERQQRAEQLNSLNSKADQHYKITLLRYWGLLPWKKLVLQARENEDKAVSHFKCLLQRKVIKAWYQYVVNVVHCKNLVADELNRLIIIKKYFQNWKKYKSHMEIMEARAHDHYLQNVGCKCLRAWADFSMEQKIAFWDKEQLAKEHHLSQLKKKSFSSWKFFLKLEKEEQLKEKRRDEMRRKVASILPDFGSSVFADSQNL